MSVAAVTAFIVVTSALIGFFSTEVSSASGSNTFVNGALVALISGAFMIVNSYIVARLNRETQRLAEENKAHLETIEQAAIDIQPGGRRRYDPRDGDDWS